MKSPWRRGTIISVVVLALTFLYALVRYHVIRATPLAELPLFTLNKAVALSSAIVIGLSYLLGSLARFFPRTLERHLALRKPFGLVGFGLGALHVLMSLALFSPEKYPKFYTAGVLNDVGSFSMGFGVAAFVIFALVALASFPLVANRLSASAWGRIQHLGYLAYAFVLAHVAVMGWRGWQNPEAYSYGFISISLLAALFIILVFLARALSTLVKK